LQSGGELTASYGDRSGLPLRLDPDRGNVQIGIPVHEGGIRWALVRNNAKYFLDPEGVKALDDFSAMEVREKEGADIAPAPTRIFKEMGNRMVEVVTAAPLEQQLPSILDIPGMRRELRLLQIELSAVEEKPFIVGNHLELFSGEKYAALILKQIIEELNDLGYTVITNYQPHPNPSVMLLRDDKGEVYRLIEKIVQFLHASEEFSGFLDRCERGTMLNLVVEAKSGDDLDSAIVIAR
jgi:hypothetical protein